jgi:hypothetical protein
MRHSCQRFARTRATRNLVSPQVPILNSAFNCAIVWVHEVVHGVSDHWRIDGKDELGVPIPDCRAALLSP